MADLVEALRQRVNRVKDGRGGGRLYVLARSHDILAALQEGFTVKEIWRHLADRGEIRIQYDTFRVLVRKYVASRSARETPVDSRLNAGTETTAAKRVGSAAAKNGDREPLQAAGEPRKRFKWNPSPKIEDFI